MLGDVLSTSDSVVAALVGPWGSGKSSTLGFVLTQLACLAEIDQLDREHVVVRLNPWMVSGPEGVAEEVVAAVTTALTASGVEPAVAAAVRGHFAAVLRVMAKGAAAVGGAVADHYGVVGGRELGSAAGEVVTTIADHRAKRASTSDPAPATPATLEQAAESLSTALADHARGVLVVIDDVDRLQPDEVLALFKAVRLLGRLPFVHYLLAYDEETLLDLLVQTPVAHHRRDRALAYLEKMVPLRLEQPEVTEDHVDALIAEAWASTCAACGPIGPADAEAFTFEAEGWMRHVLTTPRVIHRFFAQLDVLLALVGPDTVDVTDLAVLTVLRLHHPHLYRSLSAARRLLTTASTLEERQVLASVLEKPDDVGVRDWQRVLGAVHRVFPRSTGLDAASALHEVSASTRRYRAHDADYVDRYFALSPLAGDVGGLDIAGALRAIAEGSETEAVDDVLDVLLATAPDRRSVLAARRLLRRIAEQVEVSPPTQDAASAAALFCRVALYPHQAGETSEQPAVLLVGDLLARIADADAPAWSALVAAVSDDRPLRPEHRPSPGAALWLLAQACTRGVPVARQADVDGLWTPLTDACWRYLVDWSRGQVDDAPPDGLGPWLAETCEAPEVERRIGSAVEDGADLVSLVSALLPLSPGSGSGGEDAVISDGGEALTAVVLRAALGAVGEEGVRAAAQGPSVEEGWPGARRRATSRLLDRAGRTRPSWSPGSLMRSALPGATRLEDLVRTDAEPDDVRVVVTVASPATSLPFAELGAAPEEIGSPRWVDTWEGTVTDAVSGSPAVHWLLTGRAAGPPTGEEVGWHPTSSRGHWIAFSAQRPVEEPDPDLVVVGPQGKTDEGQRRLSVRVLPGTTPAPGSGDPVVGCAGVLSLGLRLARTTDIGRRGDGHLAHQVLAPADLTDVAGAVLAAVRSADLALATRAAVPGSARGRGGPDRRCVVHIALICSDDIEKVIGLGLDHRQTSTGSTQFRWSAETADVSELRSAALDGPAATFTTELLTRWLGEAEFRHGVDDVVDAAVRAAAQA